MNSARLPVYPAHLATQKPRGFLIAWIAGTVAGAGTGAGPMPLRAQAI